MASSVAVVKPWPTPAWAAFEGSSLQAALGVALGLIVGKPVGIGVASWLALKVGMARLAKGLGPRHVVVLGLVAGIGFTASTDGLRAAASSNSPST